jgi:hypothetical protein
MRTVKNSSLRRIFSLLWLIVVVTPQVQPIGATPVSDSVLALETKTIIRNFIDLRHLRLFKPAQNWFLAITDSRE